MSPIFVAIDTISMDQALTWARAVGPYVGGLKLGLEFFANNGPHGVHEVGRAANKPIFLDVKLHDIPNTVAAAVRALCPLEFAYITIHASGGEEMMQKVYAKHNIHSMICGVIAPEASGWFREEIKSIDELNGKKMRFFGLGAKVMQKMGVDTQLLAGADIYPALERGTIDATEFSQPAIDLDLGFYQIAKHYYFPGWHQQSTTFELLVNMEKWNAMTKAQQALLRTACRANFTMGMAEGEAIQGAALAELKSKGVQIHRWPDSELAKLEAAWNEVAAEIAASDASFKEAWDSLQAFRAEYTAWGELGYLD